MASDGSEATTFVRKLSSAIVDGFPRWLIPDNVVSGDTLADILETHLFEGLLAAIHSLQMEGDPTEYGTSGDLFFDCTLTLVVNNPDRSATALPGSITGDTIDPRPSLSVADGFLRNALYKQTLGGYVWTLDILDSYIEDITDPEGAVARSYAIRGRKEVTRE